MSAARESALPRFIGKVPLAGRHYAAECTRCGWVGSSEELTDDAQCARIKGDHMCLGDVDEIGADRLLGVIQALFQPAEPFAWIGDYAACGGGKAVFDRELAEKITDRMCQITPVYTNPLVMPGPWQPLRAPGQIQVGDWISATVAGSLICARAQLVIEPGTAREEIVYNRKKNHYFVTSMALDGTSNHKGVLVAKAKP